MSDFLRQWGILDTKDNLWLGDNAGPRLFDDEVLARIAAQVMEMQVFGTDLGGIYKAVPFTGASHIRDEVEVKYTPERALKRIEGQ